jgi:hypothetical protein
MRIEKLPAPGMFKISGLTVDGEPVEYVGSLESTLHRVKWHLEALNNAAS